MLQRAAIEKSFRSSLIILFLSELIVSVGPFRSNGSFSGTVVFCRRSRTGISLLAGGKTDFREYVGDISIIRQVIDDLVPIINDFPLLLEKKTQIVLKLDYNLEDDFATTRGKHIIHLNAVYYSKLEMLLTDYNSGVKEGRFVKNTDWRSIIRHEAGHVVANIYNIKPLEIAKSILNTNSTLKVLDELTDALSLYSTEYEDGREIIAESFSGYYGNAGNKFADAFVKACKTITGKGGR